MDPLCSQWSAHFHTRHFGLTSRFVLTFGWKLPPALASVTKTLFILPRPLSTPPWLLGSSPCLGLPYSHFSLSPLSFQVYLVFSNYLLSIALPWWSWVAVIMRVSFGVSQTWLWHLAWTFTSWGILDKFIESSISQFLIYPIRIITILPQGVSWGLKLSCAHDRVSAQKISFGVLPSLRLSLSNPSS